MQDPQQLSVLGADRESLHSCLKFEKSAMNISVVANTFIALTKERGRSGFCPLILTSVMILIKREIPQFWTQSKHRRWTKKVRSRTRKHFRVDVLRVNLCTRIDNIFGIPFWAAAPKGPITYAFTENSPSSSPYTPHFLEARIPTFRPKFQPLGSKFSLEAQNPASRLISQPQGPNPSLQALIPALRRRPNLSLEAHILPQGPKPSLKAKIWASMPKFKPQGPIRVPILSLKLKSQAQGHKSSPKAHISTPKRKLNHEQ